ncbi:E3 ubiquitin-protein ligase HERC [Acrasis kona]|uniref:E3 ubiquitin-protein ligase HERC n=1 Tax=Acrasis kona TaxID=1008807 RepID=A0AAW2YQZ5_9EUKA
MSSTSVKLYIHKQGQQTPNEIRRFLLNRTTTFEQLYDLIKESQSWVLHSKSSLTYTDDEDDSVQLSSEADWKLAISCAPNGILRMKLTGERPQMPRRCDYLRRPRWFHTRHPTPHQVHFGIVCDGCEERNIKGERFKCTICPDFDYCGTCFKDADIMRSHGNHKFEKVERKQRGHPCWGQRAEAPFNVEDVLQSDVVKNLINTFIPNNIQQQPNIDSIISMFTPKQSTSQEGSQPNLQDIFNMFAPHTSQAPQEEEKKSQQMPDFKNIFDVIFGKNQNENVEPSPQPQPEEPKLSLEQQLKELNAMGFTDDERNKDLLKRYNGNMSRVTQVLLQ